jgi:hypothetical protein
VRALSAEEIERVNRTARNYQERARRYQTGLQVDGL